MGVFETAIEFAVKAHAGQLRRQDNVPYILHPMEVAAIVGTMTGDEETLAAAVLHDTVEDTDTTAEQIEALFGPRVARLVASETEDKRPGTPPEESWRIRKEESLQELAGTDDIQIKILWMGDKLANMRGFHRLWKRYGIAFWEAFNQKDPAQQAWYYRTIDDLLSELRDTEAWQEYHTLVNRIFEGVD